ncbi:endoglucanase [Alteromonas sp. MB-3u-76]|uniref:glycosyl hydrolase family 8 n=1 Tax=Alteromonas sp. MB-3u-76 TaxID=2058133 RepID=UPI000C30F5A9|nr:glycosyl hydrolase family 8 [Alteromonas sp. MB-3u-76]AUC89567.1 endoglucanase [Alteromonas sp. MB-3u-76]
MVKNTRWFWVLGIVIMLTSCAKTGNREFENAFSAYKALFVIDGRVIDTGNNNISHSEGQGYGLLFSVAANDRRAFDKLWTWTVGVLQRPDGLFSWRYIPCEAKNRTCVDDPNNASDGDILIAWALLRAAEKWGVDGYKSEAIKIINTIEKKLIVAQEPYTLLLPGVAGFKDDSGVQFNLSYWVFPALTAFSQNSDNPDVWKALFESGIFLIQEASFSSYKLPSDWTRINNGKISLDNVIAGEFGFNAIRIPLHLVWSPAFHENAKRDTLLAPFTTWWSSPNKPATLELENEAPSDYTMTPGMKAVVQAVNKIDNGKQPRWPILNRNTDYYSASLVLLSMLAVSDMSS